MIINSAEWTVASLRCAVFVHPGAIPAYHCRHKVGLAQGDETDCPGPRPARRSVDGGSGPHRGEMDEPQGQRHRRRQAVRRRDLVREGQLGLDQGQAQIGRPDVSRNPDPHRSQGRRARRIQRPGLCSAPPGADDRDGPPCRQRRIDRQGLHAGRADLQVGALDAGPLACVFNFC